MRLLYLTIATISLGCAQADDATSLADATTTAEDGVDSTTSSPDDAAETDDTSVAPPGDSIVDAGDDSEAGVDTFAPTADADAEPDVTPDTLTPCGDTAGKCLTIETPCTCAAQCCPVKGATCAKVGGLVVNWCCIQPGFPCEEHSNCCGMNLCKPNPAGGGNTCQPGPL